MAGYLKAIVAGVGACVASVQQAWDGGVTSSEIVAAVVAGVIAFGAVYATRNSPA